GKKGNTTFLCTEERIVAKEAEQVAAKTLDNLYGDMRALYLNRDGNLVVENNENKEKSIIPSTFEPAAREILTIGDVYSGKLYGSGMKPGNIFTYDMQSGEIDDLGILTRGRVQAYDILAHKNRLFMSSYTCGFIDVFILNTDIISVILVTVTYLHRSE